jgi:hypothetical protein
VYKPDILGNPGKNGVSPKNCLLIASRCAARMGGFLRIAGGRLRRHPAFAAGHRPLRSLNLLAGILRGEPAGLRYADPFGAGKRAGFTDLLRMTPTPRRERNRP